MAVAWLLFGLCQNCDALNKAVVDCHSTSLHQEAVARQHLTTSADWAMNAQE